MAKPYDIVVIGSGPGGYRAAVLGALRGLNVAIVERAQWGGCCLNRGCVPKKTWHHSARLIAASRHRMSERGVIGELRGDIAAAWTHQKGVVRTVRDSYTDYMKRLGIDALEGHATLKGPNQVQVQLADGEARLLDTRHVILATGSSPRVPESLPATPGRILTTDMLFDAPVPDGRRVAVVGSGVVAVEFSYILAMLGCEVTWLARSTLLRKAHYSPQAMAVLRQALSREEVEPRSEGGRIRSSEVTDDGVHIVLEDGGSVEVDWVLLGTGRHANTEGLGLDTVGVETDSHGFVRCDPHLQTNVPNIYAIGDCASPIMTANKALADATVAVANILEARSRHRDDLWVPFVVYSAVELARVGMDEDMAEDEELEPAVGFAAFETSPRALGQDDTDGFVRLIGDMDSGALLGGEIVGAEAGELIHLLALAPDRDTALRWLAEGRFNHPARSEEVLNATETMASKWGMQDLIF
ncbi:MAG: NAD(P)/FAD-dependent oxidoreductase [Gammaproteobacteria bacterium]|jgi:dihydrolipoamide dehydrogenase